MTDHVTNLLWFWFRATRLQLQIKARVNSLWPLWKLFLCDRIVLNWFAVQTRVTRWLQHYQNMSWNLPEVSSLLSKNFVMIWDSATKWNSQKLNFLWIFAKKPECPLKIWKKEKHPVFPGGHPSKYWLGSMLLNFSDLTRTWYSCLYIICAIYNAITLLRPFGGLKLFPAEN